MDGKIMKNTRNCVNCRVHCNIFRIRIDVKFCCASLIAQIDIKLNDCSNIWIGRIHSQIVYFSRCIYSIFRKAIYLRQVVSNIYSPCKSWNKYKIWPLLKAHTKSSIILWWRNNFCSFWYICAICRKLNCIKYGLDFGKCYHSN